MKVKSQKSVKVFLELNAEESLWLMGYMQNPIEINGNIIESEEDSKYRKSLFEGIKEAMGHYY